MTLGFTYGVLLLLVMVGSVVALTARPTRTVSIVTGANGYLGRQIVQSLIQSIPKQQKDETPNNDLILCLVRQRRVTEESQYWQSECAVNIMPYDMLDDGETLTNAMEFAYSSNNNNDDLTTVVDCCIYHVASIFTVTEDHTQMALDTVKGAERVLTTVANFSFRKPKTSPPRVVLTSSMAAVRGSGQTPLNGKWYTHEDWNTVSKLGQNWGSSYQWSKAESEKRCWELAEKHDIPFVALCPSFIFGPPLLSSNSHSLSLVKSWILGESSVQSRLCVDVRDVAQAHVLAGTLRNVVGKRIILSRQVRVPSEQMANELKKIATEVGGVVDATNIYPDTTFTGGAVQIGEKEVECYERVKRYLDGLEFRATETTLADMARTLLQDI